MSLAVSVSIVGWSLGILKNEIERFFFHGSRQMDVNILTRRGLVIMFLINIILKFIHLIYYDELIS